MEKYIKYINMKIWKWWEKEKEYLSESEKNCRYADKSIFK